MLEEVHQETEFLETVVQLEMGVRGMVVQMALTKAALLLAKILQLLNQFLMEQMAAVAQE